MTTQEIERLQDSLVRLGHMTVAEVATGYGIYGPKTTAAYQKYQSDIQKTAESHPVVGAALKEVKTKDPTLTFEQAWGAAGGDIGGMTTASGQPFSTADQQAALSQATSDISPSYQQQQEYYKQQAESDMAAKQAAYEKSLQDDAAKFQDEKTTMDQTAANQGVLFSGGRAQKQRNLESTYARNQAYNQSTTGTSIGNIGRDYAYKFGTPEANSLSQYYNLPGQTYNANVATGGTNRSGLSAIYNPNAGQSFGGTQVAEKSAAAQARAAGLLWNKGNKIVSLGYKNQY